MNAIPSYPPRLSPTATTNVRAADRISVEIIGTVVDRPRWGIVWSTRDGARGIACEDLPEDYPDGAPEGHTPGQGLAALFASPECAIEAIEATGTEAHLFVDGAPQTLDAADAIDAELLEVGRWAVRYQTGVDAHGDGISVWYCRDCGHLIADDPDDGCERCGWGRLPDDEEDPPEELDDDDHHSTRIAA